MSSTEPASTAVEHSAPAQVLEVENSIDIYQVSAEWIRFADAKAAVALTVSGALAGLLIPSLKTYLDELDAGQVVDWLAPFVLGSFALFILLLIASGVLAFRCILPDRTHPARNLCTHFHPAGISTCYRLDEGGKFIERYEQLGTSGLRREVLAAILIDAHICNRKYYYVTQSIRVFALSSAFGLMFLLLSQF